MRIRLKILIFILRCVFIILPKHSSLRMKLYFVLSLLICFFTPPPQKRRKLYRASNHMAFLFILSIPLFYSCKCGSPDELFYKKAEILDIKRDDESQYHLLIKYEDGSVESIADAKCSLKMGDYTPSCTMPFVKWENCNNQGILEAWEPNSSNYSSIPIIVSLPNDYKIELFND